MRRFAAPEAQRGGPVDPRSRVVFAGEDIAEHVRKAARWAGERFDKPRTVGAHCWRHTLATWLDVLDVPQRVADRVTRHQPTVASTRDRHYVDRDQRELHEQNRRELHAAASPIPDLLSPDAGTGSHSGSWTWRHTWPGVVASGPDASPSRSSLAANGTGSAHPRTHGGDRG